jgi:hypothetical protein
VQDWTYLKFPLKVFKVEYVPYEGAIPFIDAGTYKVIINADHKFRIGSKSFIKKIFESQDPYSDSGPPEGTIFASQIKIMD